MSSQPVPSATGAPPGRSPGCGLAGRELPSDVQALLDGDGPLDARVLLSRHPELRADKSIAIDLAYEEYCRRRQGGQPPDPDEFCDRFPALQTSLRDLIQADRYLEENAQLVAEPVPWPRPGDSLLGFDLIAELGRGAFARVFLASETALGGRRVAVKVALHGAAEAETLGRLQHPNIVPVHSVRQDPASGLTVICMSYLGRATLSDVLDTTFAAGPAPGRAGVILGAVRDETPAGDLAGERRPDPILARGTYTDGVVQIAAQLADALAYVHAQGVCHRDLKPSNVLMTPDGRPMLLDFNLSSQEQAGVERIAGTLPYMAPEQLRGMDRDAPAAPVRVDARSDLFSLGVMLYELLTGAHPFGPICLKLSAQQQLRHLLEQQRQGSPPVRQRNPAVDRHVASVVERCLAADPDERPQSAAELAAELRRHQSPARRAWRWIVRHARSVGAALVLALAAGLVAVHALPAPEPASLRQLRAGLQCDRDGQYQQAIDHFNEALAADANLGWAYFGRGWARQKLDDISAAIDDYEKADDRVQDGRIKAALGYCRAFKRQYPEAIAWFQQAIREDCGTAAVYNDIGLCYLQRENPQLDKGRQSLDMAVGLDENLQAAWHNRALVDLTQSTTSPGHVPRAGYRDIQQALGLPPRHAELYYTAGCLAACLAKHDDRMKAPAIQHLSKAIRLGQDPASLDNEAFFAALVDEPGFRELRLAARAQPPLQVPRLVDPIEPNWPLSLLEVADR